MHQSIILSKLYRVFFIPYTLLTVTSYIIQGNSTKPLQGEIKCSGAKNFSIKACIAALLSRSTSTLHNIPTIGDMLTTVQLLESLGVKCKLENQTITIDPENLQNHSKINKANRITISLLGILAHWFEKAILPDMDGCKLGARSVDFHIQIYKAFGIQITHNNGSYTMEKTKQLTGQKINLPYPSVGATETAIFLAVKAKGLSIIDNISLEPEILELITMLQTMGAQISWHNKHCLHILGTDQLHGANFNIMPDRLEVVSWAVLAAISNGEITISNLNPAHLQSFIGHFLSMGGGIRYKNQNTLTFYQAKPLTNSNLSASTYPKLATDQLAQMSVLAAFANGISTIHDSVYENRVLDIQHMLGAFGIESTASAACFGEQCRFSGHNHIHSLTIRGGKLNASANKLTVPKNIRCAHSYLLLASQLDQKTVIHDPTNSINRGYGSAILVEKMQKIGINITCDFTNQA